MHLPAAGPCACCCIPVVACWAPLTLARRQRADASLRACFLSNPCRPAPTPTLPLCARRSPAQVAAGVQQLHTAGLIHGELRPENILVCRTPPRATATQASPQVGPSSGSTTTTTVQPVLSTTGINSPTNLSGAGAAAAAVASKGPSGSTLVTSLLGAGQQPGPPGSGPGSAAVMSQGAGAAAPPVS